MINQSNENAIKGEIYSVERLEEFAVYLAAQLDVGAKPKVAHSLLPRMRDNGIKLLESYRTLTDAVHKKQSIPPAAEWLTDNFHIIEDQLREIQEDLPPAFYNELPKISLGELSGYPRIYAIALALIAHTDSQLEPDTIRRFVLSYQKVSTLKIGELWALAITLRLVLVENLRRIAVQMVADYENTIFANNYVDRLIELVANKSKFQNLILKLPKYWRKSIHNDSAVMAQFAKRLRDQEPELFPALEALEKHLAKENSSIEHIVHLSHHIQASNQISVANIITSMRLLSSLNWRDFFESLSMVDRVLEKDPVYSKMDFLTRDRYRHVIEKLSKKTQSSEIEISEKLIQIISDVEVKSPEDSRKSHIGYYLIGQGAKKLHLDLAYQNRLLYFAQAHPNLIYFGLMGILLGFFCAAPLVYSVLHGASLALLFGISLLILIPCSDLALTFSNFILTHAIRPKNLPKLDFSSGIPETARTMVVIPCMLSNPKVVLELVEKIEIHFLGNSDNQLLFALLTDFTDADTEIFSTDDDLVRLATESLELLNQKYKGAKAKRFFLFHRRRQWNESENAWMGWERKRGKIHEFNRLLRGNKNTSFTMVTAPRELLQSVRFVITLDADTQLPRDTARKMVGTIMHPLNQAKFDQNLGRVVDGYGVLQPRIGISLESSGRSAFAKLFSGNTGIDPYTTAVSDVYQDLYHEGSYTGKGLYDVDAFEAALNNRIPENSILSHDLFEGLFARTALLTDVELIDDYPQSYHSYFTRQHRWTRGDWQISSWILPFVRNQKNAWVRNRLPLISRWKIFDNLRRSFVSLALFLWLVLAWSSLPGSPLFWTASALFIIVSPGLFHAIYESFLCLFKQNQSRFLLARFNIKTSLLQCFLRIVFLAHQAIIHLDALIRVLYRKNISKLKLLEWAPAAHMESQKFSLNLPFWQSCWPTEGALLACALFTLIVKPPRQLMPALILLALYLLWFSHPAVAFWISRKSIRRKEILKPEAKIIYRQIARRTWHYFESFVGSSDNWLPPDNHQEFPQALTAHRTSPTNIGLYLLSALSAYDMGFVSSIKFIKLLNATLESMKKLEMHEGHYYNWYDTQSLQTLHPKYVSTVDSGNLAGYLLVTREACLKFSKYFVVDQKVFSGLRDLLLIAEGELKASGLFSSEMNAHFSQCYQLLSSSEVENNLDWAIVLDELALSFENISDLILKITSSPADFDIKKTLVWIEAAGLQLKETKNDLKMVAPWANSSRLGFTSQIASYSEVLSSRWEKLVRVSIQNCQFSEISKIHEHILKELKEIRDQISQKNDQSINQVSGHLTLGRELTNELSLLIDATLAGKAFVLGLLSEAEEAAQFLEQQFGSMNFSFLLDKLRGVFSIGYNVTEGKFDSGLYDLLGSESRLASFLAIAKGDATQEHWFLLGRQLVPVSGGRALISWTASMFEYLMPNLIMRNYENTLLNESIHSVVSRQIQYGNENRVPWGVSEAGYNARDLQFNYQYGPFGIPGLGLKRGLSQDLVISPYSTILAAQIRPIAAYDNLKVLIENKLLREYGFYESIDYTSERLPENQKFAVVKSFMAHHQGMSLVSINNMLHDNIMHDRFHSDTRVMATRLLLQERIPQGITPVLPKAAEIELESEPLATTSSFVRHYTDPSGAAPKIQLLSNRNYSIMISTAGGGYSKCNDLAVTRWKEDPTRDNYGSYIFIKDSVQDKLWSSTYQPLAELPEFYQVSFGEEKVEFRRRDGDISSHTQILVAPEDNVEIRHLTLTNHSSEARTLELTSYLEPVLGPPANDLDHPAFSKLFIQTEFLFSKNAILAGRRKRSSNDKDIWGLHVVVTDGDLLADIEYETDRMKFIGRGRTLSSALALFEEKSLSNTCGATLDPILSLRVKVQVPANGKLQVAFTTGLAPSHEKALELADRYHDIHAFERECKIAWTKSQVDMRHLNIDSAAAHLYQRLAERILYSESTLRPPAHKRAVHTNVQSSLWPSGISGDLPIVAIRINDLKDIAIIRKLLRCQEYLRLKGLVYDFIIINEHRTTYFQTLQDELQQLIRTTGSQIWQNKSGGIYILRRDITPEKDIDHIQAVARVSLSADLPLNDQIRRQVIKEHSPEPLPTLNKINLAASAFVKDRVFAKVERNAEALLTANELDFFNGFGGFSKDGSKYIIQLHSRECTPAPWINVIGNELGFGFQVSESGSSYTWNLNSQTNRLTPWSNDPVTDPSGEIIYLRDDDTGEIWTPTPQPIRSDALYTIEHGQGFTHFKHIDHGIEHSLIQFVPQKESIKISLFKIKNLTVRKRRISVSSYTEWVLGSRREKTSPYLICELDRESGAIFASNPHDDEFASMLSFADFSSKDRTFTCSRKEFLGRNGNYANPAALKFKGLGQKRGTGNDPCAVLQTSFELDANETYEMTILLGQSESREKARELSLRYRDIKNAKLALDGITDFWKKLINVIQVKTPDPATNILMNNWLLYQTLSCRYWSRTALYQSGGAYGFRDQLQDSMSFVYAAPEITKEHIIRSCEHQFKEGDVQHWWHPPSGRGLRTRMSDDLLWLPFVVSHYIQVTGDKAILNERVSFIEAPLLVSEEEDSYSRPNVSVEMATVFEHCIRAIKHSLSLGEHNLPLIGTGDWNDGMNRVGYLGKGESIWLGWFLYKVLEDFVPLCNQPENLALKEQFVSHMALLKSALETSGWDGDWYRRAYYDSGDPLGSASNEECKIDSIAQSWAVLSNCAEPKRASRAMQKVADLLIHKKSQLILLFTPPFDRTTKDPGYIKGYVPGVRENGGQYTHAAIWVVMAYAKLGLGNKSFEIFQMLNPIQHSKTTSLAKEYRIEPYVIAADIYSGTKHEGRGGWSWYTGSASWYYRAGLESILGFDLRGNILKLHPNIPSDWKTYEISYLHGQSQYVISIMNPMSLCSGKMKYKLDGKELPGQEVILLDDGKQHHITASLNA